MNESVSKVVHHPATIPVGVGVASFIGGVVLGVYLERRKMKAVEQIVTTVEEDFQISLDFDAAFEDIRHEEEPEVRVPTVIIDEEHLLKLRENFDANGVEDISVSEEDEDEPENELVRQSIFAHDDEEWNYEEEVKKRTPDEPYIIHKDEFFSDEMGLHQMTLNYYAGDNIMCDEEDTPVYNHAAIVGPLLFGHGSGDPNVVYIRNEKRKAEYEILHNVGLYSVEVLNLEIENNERNKDIKHSTVRKFRQE